MPDAPPPAQPPDHSSRRFDALGSTNRAALFPGDSLADTEDGLLQELVERAAAVSGAPIALVSLVTDHCQLFRAQVGLPPDLALSRATDRDVSFCQLVVAEESPLQVEHAAMDARVPQELVLRYGIQAYLGMPVQIRGEVVGSLCVIDLEPREFDAEARSALQQLSRAVTARLDRLAAQTPDATEVALRPAFSELRNALTPIGVSLELAAMTLAEIAPLARLTSATDGPVEAPRALAVLTQAASAFDCLDRVIVRLQRSIGRVTHTVLALEASLVDQHGPVPLSDILGHASQLALHATRLVGGLHWPMVDASATVTVARKHAITDLSALLAQAAGAMVNGTMQQGMRPQICVTEAGATISLEVPEAAAERLARSVTPLLELTTFPVSLDGRRVSLFLPA